VNSVVDLDLTDTIFQGVEIYIFKKAWRIQIWIQVRMDPHRFEKLHTDPDPHQSGKLNPDPHPHQSAKAEALEDYILARCRSKSGKK
jgi:hypothetical protein